MTHLILSARRWLGHFVIVCSLGGCTTTATITRVNGRSTDAEITGIDRENVYVKTDSGSRPIPRKEITDIDHPGDTATVIGLILGVYGVANIAVGAKYCDSKGNVYCAGVFAPAAIGFPMAIWGIAVHTNSTNAMLHSPDWKTVAKLRVVPSVTTLDGKRAAGATIQADF